MLGDNLRKERKKKGWSQKKLGIMANLSTSYIQQLELGQKLNPSVEVIISLCNALHISPFDLEPKFKDNDIYIYYMNSYTDPLDDTDADLIPEENAHEKEFKPVDTISDVEKALIDNSEITSYILFKKLLKSLKYDTKISKKDATYLFKKTKKQIETEIEFLNETK